MSELEKLENLISQLPEAVLEEREGKFRNRDFGRGYSAAVRDVLELLKEARVDQLV